MAIQQDIKPAVLLLQPVDLRVFSPIFSLNNSEFPESDFMKAPFMTSIFANSKPRDSSCFVQSSSTPRQSGFFKNVLIRFFNFPLGTGSSTAAMTAWPCSLIETLYDY
jgi:hypothetical protein